MFLKLIFLSYITLISLISFINGFTTDLIHRDSLQSPINPNSIWPSQRMTNALKRSIHRARVFEQKISKSEPQPEAYLVSSGGEYLMKFSVGTPPVPTIVVADTGSDVIWTQCQPCLECFNQSLPFFSPRKSSTYKRVHCSAPVCKSLHELTHCSPTRKNCLYDEQYGDGSSTSGILATEIFTFQSSGGKTVTIPDMLFGCGFKNSGLFAGVESGVFGLGGGKASFVSQLGEGRFSYCLVPFEDLSAASKLHFGREAEVSGGGVVSTPLFFQKGLETFYLITMEGISVGKKKFPFPASSPHLSPEKGNTIIDSGTTLTLLPPSLYHNLKKAINKTMKLERIQDPDGVLDLCYSTKGEIKGLPEITVHFKGADLKWTAENAFVRLSKNIVCLAAQGNEGIPIYGNLAQVNFLIGYDNRKKILSFKPADCRRS